MRLFIAIDLCPEFKKILEDHQRKLSKDFGQDLKFPKTEALHLTLKFLGEVEDSRLEKLKEVMAAALEQISAYEVALSNSGCFPPKGKLRIVWTGVKNTNDELIKCQAKLEDALAELGFEREERAFTPHITIARVKKKPSKQNIREVVAQLESPQITQQVTKIALIQSMLGPKGAKYNILHEVKLK